MRAELTPEDEQALAWAVSTRSPTGRALTERFQRGDRGLTTDDVAPARRAWEAAGRPWPRIHHYREVVTFPDGTTILAASFLGPDPYARDDPPTYGLYLDERWAPPWPHAHVPWPDFGLPPDAEALRASLRDVLDRARRGERVEVACVGGHGRTGTALACLATLTGVPASDAVAWVRGQYCDGAVETEDQRAFVESFGGG